MSTSEEAKSMRRTHSIELRSESEGAAVIFVRHRATMGIGHVGWGFLLHPGEKRSLRFSLFADSPVWKVGAVENHHGSIVTPPLKDGYWCHRTAQPVNDVAGRGYDHYKVLTVPEPDVERALQEEALIKERPYIAAVGNCMNDVFSVLTAYGVRGLPDPSFILNWMPNAWYGRIEAPEFEIKDRSGLEVRRPR